MAEDLQKCWVWGESGDLRTKSTELWIWVGPRRLSDSRIGNAGSLPS